MNLTGYLRYSPGGEDSSLEIQREAITKWAKQEGHKITSWHEDAGISGAEDLSVRVGLFCAIETLRSGSAGIIVRELSRFSRDVINQEMYIRQIESRGGKVFSTNSVEQQFLTDAGNADHTRKMIRTIMGAIWEWEKSSVVLRMAAGRAMAAQMGKYAYGSPPFGSATGDHPSGKGSELVPVEAEQAAITRMRELRDGGASLRDIAAALEAEGIGTKLGKRWHAATVARTLARAEAAAGG